MTVIHLTPLEQDATDRVAANATLIARASFPYLVDGATVVAPKQLRFDFTAGQDAPVVELDEPDGYAWLLQLQIGTWKQTRAVMWLGAELDWADLTDVNPATLTSEGAPSMPNGERLISAVEVAATYLPFWKPNTAYVSGQRVVNPSGQTVTANADFTSGANYVAGNWTVVAGGGGTVSDATTSAKGIVQLTGDLGGTAAAPTVPGKRSSLTQTGYDIVLCIGQSNMSGRATADTSRYDLASALVDQYAAAGPYASVISAAIDPLGSADYALNPGLGPATTFARWYATTLDAGRRLLLVPAAYGGTALSTSSTSGWRRGVAGNRYANALAQVQAALVLAGGGAKVVAALWVQGEADGDANTPGSTYQTDLDALITGLRADLGLPNLPFIIGGIVPEYLSTGTRAAIDTVQQGAVTRLTNVGYIGGPHSQNLGDGNHYNPVGQRLLGRGLFAAYRRVINPNVFPAAVQDDGNPAGSILTNTAVPTISGTATIGSVLTVSNGSWSATPDSYTYQWKRAGAAISGATASTYTLVTADGGQQITATVTAVKAGYSTGTATTAATSVPGGTITNTAAPTISGTTTVGSVLTATTGTWTPTPDSYTYQWSRAGAAISGATASTYTLVSADSGTTLTVAVSAVKAGYTTATTTSAATATIAAGGGAGTTDSFTRADSTSSIGGTWQTLSGTWGIKSNQAYLVAGSSSAPWSVVAQNGASADNTVSVDELGFVDGSMGLAFRISDASNYIAIRLNSNTLECYKVIAGSPTSLGATAYTHGSSATTTLTVVTSGSTITLKANGVTITTITEAFNSTATKFGLWGVNLNGSSVWDNFVLAS